MAVKEKLWTYQDYLQLEDGKRYEIIEGELLEMPAPGIRHQKVLWNLTGLFRDYHARTKRGLFLFAPVDVVLSETEVVQPDLLYISEDRLSIVKERAVEGVPDMVVEIVSPASYIRDTHEKKKLYAKHGIREYWLILPELKLVEVLILEGADYRVHSLSSEKGRVCSKVLEGFCVDLAEVFGESP